MKCPRRDLLEEMVSASSENTMDAVITTNSRDMFHLAAGPKRPFVNMDKRFWFINALLCPCSTFHTAFMAPLFHSITHGFINSEVWEMCLYAWMSMKHFTSLLQWGLHPLLILVVVVVTTLSHNAKCDHHAWDSDARAQCAAALFTIMHCEHKTTRGEKIQIDSQ